MDGHAISFGPFRLLAAQRLLLEGDNRVRLGSRAFDILAALIERAGEVVSKDDLIARAWPTTFVEEANLKIQVNALRRALGDGQRDNRYVATVIGRGYNFVAPIRTEASSRASPSPTFAPTPLHKLPFATIRMIGREEIATTLVTQFSHQRLVTVVGPGGIGKTTLGLAVAERMIGAYEHGVWLVDLAPLRDPDLVPSAVATVLGLEIRTEDPLPTLIAALRDSRMLLMLDNCEHVIDAAAGLTAAVLSGAPGVNILATSREPLAVQGERVYRLGPLNSPRPSTMPTAVEAAAFPAVQLFVERVTAIVEDFVLTDANAPLVVAICRRLDGLPLAIEFAAPRVGSLGVEGLAAGLDDRLRLLGTQRRAAMPRHRTMEAVVDWSYGLLSSREQRVFRALGIFAGGFTVDAAATVAMDAATTGADAIDRLADLVAKSLVVADVSGTRPRFHLLDTIRAYTLTKLQESGEHQPISRRRAKYCCDLFRPAEGEAARSTDEWLADCDREIDNVRAAREWAFSADGDHDLGVALTVAAVPLLIRLSLLNECRERSERALAVLQDEPATAVARMRLYAALGWSLAYGVGRARETAAAWTKTLEMAEVLGNIEFRRHALWGLCIDQFNTGNVRTALSYAEQFAGLVSRSDSAIERMKADRILATSLHYLGDQKRAHHHIDQALSYEEVVAQSRSHTVSAGFDLLVSTHYFQARILWLRGFADRSLGVVALNVEEGRAFGQALSYCSVLGQSACPLTLLSGDLDAAERYGALLLEHTERNPIRLWNIWARCFNGLVTARRGDVARGMAALRDGLKLAGDAQRLPRFLLLRGEYARNLGGAGAVPPAIEIVDEMLAACANRDEGWYVAELLRIKAELLLRSSDRTAEANAETLLLRSCEEANRQGALAWELRAAASLARLRLGQERRLEAIGLPRAVYARFTEGFGTADLVAAKRPLDELGAPDPA